MVKPILFNTEMVRAILQGRKVVTRRVVKGSVPDGAEWGTMRFTHQDRAFCHWEAGGELFGRDFKLPYRVGDTLYVREKWCNANKEGYEPGYHYFADTHNPKEWKWRPSIHMPKDAARIWLKVTDVRVERLQDVSGQGLIDEGAVPLVGLTKGMMRDKFHAFQRIWDSTIRKADIDRYGWAANPWVWVVRFERCERPGREEDE